MLEFESIVHVGPVVLQDTYISCFGQLERSKCIDTHESNEVKSAIVSAEYILMVNKVCAEEEE